MKFEDKYKRVCKCGHNEYNHFYSGSEDTDCRFCGCKKFVFLLIERRGVEGGE